ncbi:MAG: hypothetical protein KDD00_05225 [Ignavibacteriae bacterium]|nr:hypothetical protein [Ignavibacteriota bacterium]
MKESELKIKIFRHVDSLDRNKLTELYGLMLNYLKANENIEEWNKLTIEERMGIEDAINEIDSDKFILHEKVLKKFRKKYSNA